MGTWLGVSSFIISDAYSFLPIINLSYCFFLQSASHQNQPCGRLKAWVLSHKDKATANIDWNPDNDPAESYSNSSIPEIVSQYTEAARTVHGEAFDPHTADLDGDLVMRVGGGKKRGRYIIGNSTLDPATTPTLAQVRANSRSESVPVRPRVDTSTHRVATLQVISILFVIH